MTATIFNSFLFQGTSVLSSQAGAGQVCRADDPQQLATSLGVVQGRLRQLEDAGEGVDELCQVIDRYCRAARAEDHENLGPLQRQVGDLLPRLSDAVWWEGLEPFVGPQERSLIFLRRSQQALQGLADRMEDLYEDTGDFATVSRLEAGLAAFFDAGEWPAFTVQRKVGEIAERLQDNSLRSLARGFGIPLPQVPALDLAVPVASRRLPDAIARYVSSWHLDDSLRQAVFDMLDHAAERSVAAALANMSWNNRKPQVGRQWLSTYARATRLGHIGPAAKLRLIHLLGESDSFGKTAPMLWPASQQKLGFDIRSLWPAPLQLGRRFGHRVQIQHDPSKSQEQLLVRPAVLAEDGRYYDHAVLANGHTVQVWQQKKQGVDLGYENGRLVGPPHLARLIVQAAGGIASGQRSGFTLMVIAPDITPRMRRFFFRHHPQGRILHWSRYDYKLYTLESKPSGAAVECMEYGNLNDGSTTLYRTTVVPEANDLTVTEQSADHPLTPRLIQEKIDRVIDRLPERNRKEFIPSLQAARDVALYAVGALSPYHRLSAAVLSALDTVPNSRLTESRARSFIERLHETLRGVENWMAPFVEGSPQLIDLPAPVRATPTPPKKRSSPPKSKAPREDALPWTDDMRAFLGQVIPRTHLNMRKVNNLADFFRLARIQFRVAHQNELIERFRDMLSHYPQQAKAMERELDAFIKGRQQTLSNQTLAHLVRIAALATGQVLPTDEPDNGSEPPHASEAATEDHFDRAIQPIGRRLEQLTEIVAEYPRPEAVPEAEIPERAAEIETIAAESLALYEQLDQVDRKFGQEAAHSTEAVGRLEERIVSLEQHYEPLVESYRSARQVVADKSLHAAAERERRVIEERVQLAAVDLAARVSDLCRAMNELEGLMNALKPPIGAAAFAEQAAAGAEQVARILRRAQELESSFQAANVSIPLAEEVQLQWDALRERIEDLRRTVEIQVRPQLEELKAKERETHWSAPVTLPSQTVIPRRFFDATLSASEQLKDLLVNVPPDRYATINAYPEFAWLASDEDAYQSDLELLALIEQYGVTEQYLAFKDDSGIKRTGRVLLRSQLLGRLGGMIRVKTVEGDIYKISATQVLHHLDTRRVVVEKLRRCVHAPANYSETKIMSVARRIKLAPPMVEQLVYQFERAHQGANQNYGAFITYRTALYTRMMSLEEESRQELLDDVLRHVVMKAIRKRIKAALKADNFLASVQQSYESAVGMFQLKKAEAAVFFYMMFYPFIEAIQTPKVRDEMAAELRGHTSEADLLRGKRVGWTQRFLTRWRASEGSHYGQSLDVALQGLRVLSTPQGSYFVAGKGAERAAAYLGSDQRDKAKLSDVLTGDPILLPKNGWGFRLGGVSDLPSGSSYHGLMKRFELLAQEGGLSRALLEIVLSHNGSLLTPESRQELMAVLCHRVDREADVQAIELGCVMWVIQHASKLKKVTQFRSLLNSFRSCYGAISEVKQFHRPIPLKDLQGRYLKEVGGATFLIVVDQGQLQ